MMRACKLKGVFQHYRGGLYKVVCAARDERTLERLVVYRAFARRGEHQTWVRTRRAFEERVMHEGRSVRRFEPLK